MSRLIAALALLTTCVVALAETPQEAVVEDIVELRQAYGASDAFATDERQFAEAVERVADDAARNGSRGLHDRPNQPPSGWQHQDQRAWGSVDDGPQTEGHDPGLNHPAPGWRQPPLFGSHPSHAPRPHVHGPPKERKSMLMESAFELERIAHRLDMADLDKQADAVRKAARELRESAREPRGKTRMPQRKLETKAQAGETRELMKQRLLREARKRTEQMIAEADREAAEMLKRAEAKSEQLHEMLKRTRDREKELVIRAQDAEIRARIAEQRGAMKLDPPKVVHGGPRDGRADSAPAEAAPQ